MKKVHYIGMAGLHGCLPATCDVYDSVKSAAESLADLHELSKRKASELKKYRYLELDFHKHGNEYAEIVDCDCDDPESHSDS